MRYLEGVSFAAFAKGSRKLWAWLSYRPTWAHAGYGALALFFFWHQVHKYLADAVGGGVALWVILALIAGQEPHQPVGDQQPARDGVAETAGEQHEGDEIQEAPPFPVLVALIRHVAALSNQGTAAHLQDVLAEAQKRNLLGGWEVPDLREELEAHRVPVTDKKKLSFGPRSNRREKVRMGVLLEHLPEVDAAPVPALAQQPTGRPSKAPAPLLPQHPPQE